MPAATTDSAAPATTGMLSFVDVFQNHAAYVLGLLRRLGVSPADVEDVAQEVFLAIHAGLPGFEGRSTLKSWICGICLRRASDYRRRMYRRREVPVTGTFEASAQAEPEARMLHDERALRLSQALAALPEKQLHVFVLYEIEELPMAHVARAVGCPRFTAYTRLRAARREIRAFLARGERPGRPR